MNDGEVGQNIVGLRTSLGFLASVVFIKVCNLKAVKFRTKTKSDQPHFS